MGKWTFQDHRITLRTSSWFQHWRLHSHTTMWRKAELDLRLRVDVHLHVTPSWIGGELPCVQTWTLRARKLKSSRLWREPSSKIHSLGGCCKYPRQWAHPSKWKAGCISGGGFFLRLLRLASRFWQALSWWILVRACVCRGSAEISRGSRVACWPRYYVSGYALKAESTTSLLKNAMDTYCRCKLPISEYKFSLLMRAFRQAHRDISHEKITKFNGSRFLLR